MSKVLTLRLPFINGEPSIYGHNLYSPEAIQYIKDHAVGLSLVGRDYNADVSFESFSMIPVESLIGTCVSVTEIDVADMVGKKQILLTFELFRDFYNIADDIAEAYKTSDVYAGPRAFSTMVPATELKSESRYCMNIDKLACFDLIIAGHYIDAATLRKAKPEARCGRLIVFEGPDKCGKTTQKDAVVETLRNLGYKVFTTHFPNYDSVVGKKIKDMLNDPKVDLIHNRDDQFVFAELQIIDKLSSKSFLLEKLKEYDFVILDRYILSGIAYDKASFTSCYATGNFGPMTNYSADMDYFAERYAEVTAGLNIEHVFFRQSKILAELCKLQKRESDNLDNDDKYQRLVDAAYLAEFNSGKYNVLMTVDTDEVYANLVRSENESILKEVITNSITLKIDGTQPSHPVLRN